jgi:hypothetical protein
LLLRKQVRLSVAKIAEDFGTVKQTDIKQNKYRPIPLMLTASHLATVTGQYSSLLHIKHFTQSWSEFLFLFGGLFYNVVSI